jgi:uncharacterized protein YndB with AHSA1/START domain
MSSVRTMAGSAGAETAGREIVATRVFDAPREIVFKAWTDQKHLARWWGPNGFTITTYAMDFRVGGAWRFVMHGPDGRDYRNENLYVEIVEPERLVYRHVSAPKHQTTVTFADEDGKTMVTVRMVFESAALREHTVKQFNAVEGLRQTLGRLGEYVKELASSD